MSQIALITVSGRGSVSTMPDAIRIELSIQASMLSYPDTLASLNKKVAAIHAALKSAGAGQIPATKSYAVTEVWTDARDTSKRVFHGYRANQSMALTIALDNALLGRIIASLADDCAGQPSINFKFEVRDRAAMEKAARIAAVQHARESAIDLAETSGLQLLAVKSIDFRGGSGARKASLNFEVDHLSDFEMNRPGFRGGPLG